jgi:hypothetical protein
MLINNSYVLEAKKYLGGLGSSLLEPYFKKTIEQGKKTIKAVT